MEQEPITWQARIDAIVSSGLTRKEVADECEIPYSTLSDIANGTTREPRGDAAVRLHSLYLLRCKTAPKKRKVA